MAHVQVRNKMRERQPGSEPQSGDRVPYILLDTGDPKAKAYEKAEDPKYAKDNNLKVDYAYYFIVPTIHHYSIYRFDDFK